MRSKTVNNVPATTPATANFNGAAVPIENMVTLSAQFVVVGATSPVGTGKVQVSNDVPPDGNERVFVPTNWNDLPLATIAINANAAFFVPVTLVCARWARLVFTYTSGTSGTVNGNLHTQGW